MTPCAQDVQAQIAGMRQAQEAAEARLAELEGRKEASPQRQALAPIVVQPKAANAAQAGKAAEPAAEARVQKLADALGAREKLTAELQAKLKQQQAQHEKVSTQPRKAWILELMAVVHAGRNA